MAYKAENYDDMNENMPNSQNNDDLQKEKQKEATKDAIKTGAKAAGMAYGGPAGAAAVDTVANSAVGQKVLNEGAEKLNKIPGVAEKTSNLKDSGALDAANIAMDVASKNSTGSGAATNTAGSATDATKSTTESTVTSNNAGESAPDKNNAGDKTPASSDSKDNSSEKVDNDTSDDTGNSSTSGKVTGKAAMTIAKASAFIIPLVLFFLILIFVLAAIGGTAGDFDDALSAYAETGGDTGGMDYEASSKEAKNFMARIKEAKSSMESEGEELDIIKLVAVYHIINRGDAKYDYDYFTTDRLRAIAREITTDEDETKNNLANSVFPKYFPNNNEAANKQMAGEVYEYIYNYNSIMGIKDEEDDEYYDDDCTGGTGTCTYDIKGFHIGGSIYKKKMNIANLKVRLMQCGGTFGNGSDTKPIKQPLVNFEDYAAGVAYAEVGTSFAKAAQQAQMIAARSYGLARPTAMHNAAGKKLSKEDGKWVLQIASCVSDQVYCDINKGCSYMGGGSQGGYVVIGTDKSSTTKGPLPQNSKTRKYANEVQGKLLVDKKGYVVSTSYTSKEQHQMNALAKSGKDYKQILLKMYPAAADIYTANCGQTNCSDDSGGGSTGNFANWRQFDKRWGSTPMGGSGRTLGEIGCLVTATSMLIAKSGVSTGNIKPFNPGTFAKALNKVGGIDGNGNFVWSKTSQVVPNFSHAGTIYVSGMSQSQKLKKLKELTNQGYYVVAQVGSPRGSQHWIAIDKVRNNSILIMDAGYGRKKMWDNFYPASKTTVFAYFKAKK